jgi:hypothetical protein
MGVEGPATWLDGGSAHYVRHRPHLLPAWNYNPAVRGLAIECRGSRAAKTGNGLILTDSENKKKRAAGTRHNDAFLFDRKRLIDFEKLT